MEDENGVETQERIFAERIWNRLLGITTTTNNNEETTTTMPVSKCIEGLTKLGLPVHLVSLPTFSSEIDFKGFLNIVQLLRAAVESDPERELVEAFFDENMVNMDVDDIGTHIGIPIDVLVRLPVSLGYAPLRSTELDDFLKHFPSIGGRVSKENVVAGFLRVRGTLRRLEENHDDDVDIDADAGAGADSVAQPSNPSTGDEQRVLTMIRAQREAAEESSASMKKAMEALQAELAAALRRSKSLEAQLLDKESEAVALTRKVGETSALKEQLERELALNKREATTASERIVVVTKEAERLARELELSRAREVAAAQQKNAEKSRVDDVGAALQKTQEDILELMAEKGRLAELVEKLIQSNRRLEDTAREDQAEIKTLRKERDERATAPAHPIAGGGGGESLAAELSSAESVEVKNPSEPPALSAQEAARLHGLVAHYSNEYTKACQALSRLEAQLEQARLLLDDKLKTNQLLTDSSLELTAQLKALERDRLALASQLRDRQRQVSMMRETIDNYANQPAAFSFDDSRENRMAMSVADVVASPGRSSRRRSNAAWCLSLFSCCQPGAASNDETRYTRLL